MSRSIDVPGLAHNAPIPLGARVGPLVCSSGIAGKDPATGRLPEDPALQAEFAFANLERFLEAAGARLAHVAKLTVTVADDAQRAPVNAAWLKRFPDPADRPARHILVHPLQHGMLVQLECVAYVTDTPARGPDR